MQGTHSLEQARLRQQQQQQQQALQQRWLAPHQRQPHQQVTGGCFLQQQGLPIQSPTATSGASTPGAAAAAVTVVWPNQPYTSPDSTIYSVPGTSSVGGWGSRGPGGAYEGQAGNALVSNASQMGQRVDAAAQAAANMVASAAMGIPRQAAPVGPGSRGIGRNVSSVMAMQTGHGSGSAQIQVDAEDRAKQHRRLACVFLCLCLIVYFFIFLCVFVIIKLHITCMHVLNQIHITARLGYIMLFSLTYSQHIWNALVAHLLSKEKFIVVYSTRFILSVSLLVYSPKKILKS